MILLDEIEKAHAEVFDVLLQVLDDGRLTDGQGRTVDFRNTVLIMTSNVRSADALRDVFRPEFLNRIDEVIEFQPLSKEQIAEIVELQLARLRERLAERRIELELTDAAKQTLAEAGWDPAYGARPLKRAIQRLVENPLALRLLEGDFADGDTIRVDAEDGEIRFEKVGAAVAVEPASIRSSRGGRPTDVQPHGARRREALSCAKVAAAAERRGCVAALVAATERELALLGEGSPTSLLRDRAGRGGAPDRSRTRGTAAGRVVHVGIAGSRTLEPPALVLGSEAVYCDVIDPGLDAAARRACPTRTERAARASSGRAPRGARPADRDLRQGRRRRRASTSRRWRASACSAPASSPVSRRSSCARSPTRRTRRTARSGASTTRSPRSPTTLQRLDVV